MTTHLKEILLLCFFFCAAVFSGCSDDKDETLPLPEGQGEVTFRFVRNKVYSISTLEEMARLKVTLEKDGKKIVLPTIDLNGDKDSLSTAAVRLENGTYKVAKYVAYNQKGTQVQEAYLEQDNLVEVVHGQIMTFYFPISIRIIYVNNQLRNSLFGICHEVFGADSTLWPKTWRIENEDLLTWENLEFEVDDYGNPSYLATIIFDKKFAGMKKMPEAVALLTTLEGIQVMDIPEFEELPDGIYKSGISSLTILNTSLKGFPKRFEEMQQLRALTVVNSKLTELPARLSKLEELMVVEMDGNDISQFPSELVAGWKKVVSLRMNDTKLTSLPANIFEMERVSTFDFRNNLGLSSLPEARPSNTHMGALFLDGCSFTTLPKVANGRMRTLSMKNNKLTSLSEADVNALSTSLTSLQLDGNRLESFPKMTSNSLIELSLNDCGLSMLPDLSALPALSWIHAANNQITQVAEGTFTGNKNLSLLDLSGNQTLASISDKAGFNLVDQEDIEDGVVVTVAKPFYLYCVKVDNCPVLNWTVPGTWCCVKNVYIENKDGELLPERNVIVYNRNSPGVTREACTHCGKTSYQLPESLDEFLEKLKK